MRRIPEAMTAWLLPGGVLAMAVGLGAHSLYHWSHADVVAQDALLTHKAPFLNMTMFTALVGVSLVLWVVFAALLVGTSHRQDREGGMAPTRKSRTLSAIFLVIFAVTISIVSFYFLMSLEAHWFSTMFAVLVFTDIVQTGTAFVAVVAGLFVMTGTLKGFLNENHLHGLGEDGVRGDRLLGLHLLLPAHADLVREPPRRDGLLHAPSRERLAAVPAAAPGAEVRRAVPAPAAARGQAQPEDARPVSVLILFAQFWELYVMVGPAVGHGEEAAHGHLPIVEFAATLGFVGLFTLVFGWYPRAAQRRAAEGPVDSGVPRVPLVA